MLDINELTEINNGDMRYFIPNNIDLEKIIRSNISKFYFLAEKEALTIEDMFSFSLIELMDFMNFYNITSINDFNEENKAKFYTTLKNAMLNKFNPKIKKGDNFVNYLFLDFDDEIYKNDSTVIDFTNNYFLDFLKNHGINSITKTQHEYLNIYYLNALNTTTTSKELNITRQNLNKVLDSSYRTIYKLEDIFNKTKNKEKFYLLIYLNMVINDFNDKSKYKNKYKILYETENKAIKTLINKKSDLLNELKKEVYENDKQYAN